MCTPAITVIKIITTKKTPCFTNTIEQQKTTVITTIIAIQY